MLLETQLRMPMEITPPRDQLAAQRVRLGLKTPSNWPLLPLCWDRRDAEKSLAASGCVRNLVGQSRTPPFRQRSHEHPLAGPSMEPAAAPALGSRPP